jgi:DNA-directed RNA polymerase specialized sigma24 family protein
MVADSRDKKARKGLTAQALEALLVSLDPDRERAGEKYEEIRLRLAKYFEWEGCSFFEEHADETINRVAQAILQGKEIRDVRAYALAVARLIHLESLRAGEKQRRAFAEMSITQPFGSSPDQSEAALECLERCLDTLPPASRDLITEYYQGDQIVKVRNRKNLAERLGLAPNTLRNRALRLRSRLESCVVLCLQQRDGLADSGTNMYGNK